jgi:uncharacterized protein YoaH (UPF0181 family)
MSSGTKCIKASMKCFGSFHRKTKDNLKGLTKQEQQKALERAKNYLADMDNYSTGKKIPAVPEICYCP